MASTYFILWALGAGFARAVMPMVATALAQGDETQVRRDTRMGLWLSVLYGVAVYPVFWWSGPILSVLGQKPEVVEIARDFLRVAGLGMVPALCVTVLQSYLAALGRTQAVLWVTLAAVGLNAALAWALIFGNWGAPELGASGRPWPACWCSWPRWRCWWPMRPGCPTCGGSACSSGSGAPTGRRSGRCSGWAGRSA